MNKDIFFQDDFTDVEQDFRYKLTALSLLMLTTLPPTIVFILAYILKH